MREFFVALWKDESGQDLAEYALLLGLIALVVVGAVTAIGGSIGDIFNDMSDKLNTVETGG